VLDGISKIAIVDLTLEHLSSAIASISKLSPSVQILPLGCNCAVEAEVEAAVTATVEKFGRLDVCFNGAGVGPAAVAGSGEVGTEDWDRVLGVNRELSLR
jgi:NAD(P)-dependent dehydrogenase (short-subunit alcohol dehydrogenase family)